MNRINLLKFFTLVLAFAGTLTVRAQCPAAINNIVGTNAVATYTALAGTVGTSIKGRYWALGNAGGIWSNTCTEAAIIATSGGTNRRFSGANNWATLCNLGCPTVADISAFAIEQDVTPGTATHTGNFATTKVAWSAVPGGWNPADVTNGAVNAGCTGGGNCITALIPMPVPLPNSDPTGLCPVAGPTYNGGTGAGSICVRFTQNALVGTGGYSGPGAGAINPVIGYEVYQINGAAAPTTGLAAGWGAAIGSLNTTTDCPANACRKLITLSPNVPSAQNAFLGIRILYEGGFKSAIMSANSLPIGGPTATSGYPSSVEAFNQTTGGMPSVQVRWTTTNETQIAGFNIFASKTSGGTFKKMNDSQIAAAGSPNTYLQTITRRSFVTTLGPTSTVYLKLVTVLKDGTTREVGPISFALPMPEPGGHGGKGGRQN